MYSPNFGSRDEVLSSSEEAKWTSKDVAHSRRGKDPRSISPGRCALTLCSRHPIRRAPLASVSRFVKVNENVRHLRTVLLPPGEGGPTASGLTGRMRASSIRKTSTHRHGQGGQHRASISAPFPLLKSYCCFGFSKLNIQFTPNRSVSMPKRAPQNVSCSGIVTAPFSLKAVKSLSSSSALSGATQI